MEEASVQEEDQQNSQAIQESPNEAASAISRTIEEQPRENNEEAKPDTDNEALRKTLEETQKWNATLQEQVETLKQMLEIAGSPCNHEAEVQQEREERRVAQEQVRTLNETIVSLNERLVSMEKDHAVELQQQRHECDVAQEQVKALNETIGSLNERLLSLGKAADTESELERLNEKLKTASRKKAQALSQLATAQASLEEKSKALEEVEKECEKLKLQFDDALVELNTVSTDLEETRSKFADSHEKAERFEKAYLELSERKTTLERELADEREVATRMTSLHEQAQEKLEKLEKEMEDMSMEQKVASKKSLHLIKDLRSQLQKEKDANELLQTSLSDAQAKWDKLQSKQLEQQSVLQQLESQVNQLRHELAEERQKSKPVSIPGLSLMRRKQSQPAATPPSDKDDVKAALAKRLEGLLSENQVLKEKISFLESSAQGYAQDMRELRQEIETLRARDVSL